MKVKRTTSIVETLEIDDHDVQSLLRDAGTPMNGMFCANTTPDTALAVARRGGGTVTKSEHSVKCAVLAPDSNE